MRPAVVAAIVLSLSTIFPLPVQSSETPLVIVVPVDFRGQIDGAVVLAESLRRFGGALADTPVRVYAPTQLGAALAERAEELSALRVGVHTVAIPDGAFAYLLGGKPYTAAEAERQAGDAAFLAIVAPNTIFLREPGGFLLPPGIALGYSTVHHQNIGSPVAAPPDPFWKRLYTVLKVPGERVFSNRALADEVELRFYFNAGSFAVRPEHGLLQRWAKTFETLTADPEMAELCAEGPRNVFLHQAALSGAALASLTRDEVVELPSSYSYPLFFQRFHGGPKEFTNLHDVVTMRYEFSFADLSEGWQRQVSAPSGILEWIGDRL